MPWNRKRWDSQPGSFSLEKHGPFRELVRVQPVASSYGDDVSLARLWG